MEIKPFFDDRTSTMTYVVYDPVLDYEPVGSKIWRESVDLVIAFIKENSLKPHFVPETHVHADHLSGAQMLKEVFPGIKTAIGERITVVQKIFKSFFGLSENFAIDVVSLTVYFTTVKPLQPAH